MNKRNEANGMRKVILLFGFDDLQGGQQAFALQELTKAMDVLVCRARKESYRQPVLSILQQAVSGHPEKPTESGNPVKALPAKMIVFAAFSDEELYHVLDLCPACGITRDVLKAALTPANSRWNAFRLCENIMEEHRKIREMQEMQNT